MHKCFYVCIIVQLLVSWQRINAQNYPVYNHYYVNPYLYNPAEAATEYTYIFFNYRQQWMGIEGAPTLSTLTFNTLLNNTRVGIGAKASNYSRGILKTTDFSVTYAYSMLFKNSTLFFGMSAGAISNSLDFNNINGDDLSDPVFSSYLANNIQPAANFGLLYRTISGLNFGLTLPQLFHPTFTSPSNFDATRPSPFDHVILSAYYKRRIDGKLVNKKKKGMKAKVKTAESYAPLEVYTLYKYAAAGNSQFEVMAKINFTSNFWLGGGYRQSYGFTGNTGITLNRVILCYSYEPGSQPEVGFSSGTHEIQLGLRLGDAKKFKRRIPPVKSLKNTIDDRHQARFNTSVEDPNNISKPDDGKKKYYVVIKAFSDFTGADALKRKLIGEKFNAEIFYYEKEKKFYVFVHETTKSSEAYEEARNLKNYTKLKDAKVLTVNESK